MRTLELEEMDLVELNWNDAEEVNGGGFWRDVVVGIVGGAIYDGIKAAKEAWAEVPIEDRTRAYDAVCSL